MPRIQSGYPFPIEQATDRTWEPGKGWKATRTWEGDEQMIQSMANNIIATSGRFVRCDIKPKPPGLATLTVSFDGIADGNQPSADPNTNEPVADADAWSLNGTDSERDIWSHESMRNLASNDPDGWHYLRTKATEASKDGTWVNHINAWDAAEFVDQATSDNALNIFRMLQSGVEAYFVSQFVLQRSRGISSASQGQVATDYVGYQFTAAQLISSEGLPSALNFGLPATGSWIKRTPSIQFDAVTGKMSVTNEYWHAYDWNNILYPER